MFYILISSFFFLIKKILNCAFTVGYTWNPPSPPGRWVDNFIAPWGTLNFHLLLWGVGAQPNKGFKIFHDFFGGEIQQGFLCCGYRGSHSHHSPTGQKLLLPPTKKSLPSRLPIPNFYYPHQIFIPPHDITPTH